MAETRIFVDVTLADGATAEDAAEQVFNLLASDPDDECPAIETVDHYGVAGGLAI